MGWWMRDPSTGCDPPILMRMGLIGPRGSKMSVLIRMDLSVGSVVRRVLDVLRLVMAGRTMSSATFRIWALLIYLSCFRSQAAKTESLFLLSTASLSSVENRQKCFLKNYLWSLNLSMSLSRYFWKDSLKSSSLVAMSLSILVLSACSPESTPPNSRCFSLR